MALSGTRQALESSPYCPAAANTMTPTHSAVLRGRLVFPEDPCGVQPGVLVQDFLQRGQDGSLGAALAQLGSPFPTVEGIRQALITLKFGCLVLPKLLQVLHLMRHYFTVINIHLNISKECAFFLYHRLSRA